MSTNYRTYVGPYVRCGVGVEVIRRIRRSCPNVLCPNHGAYMPKGYCPTCGTEISEVTFEEPTDAVDSWGICEAIGGRLVTASGDAYMQWGRENHTHVWVPNIATPWRDCRLEEWADFNLVEIHPRQITEELTEFEVFFAAEIAVFRDSYGAANVTTHWGILQDYS